MSRGPLVAPRIGMRYLAVIVLALTPSIPRPTVACSALAENAGPHELDAAFAGDLVPPSPVTITATIDDSDDAESGGCGTPVCSDGGNFVVLHVDATDDQAPTERLGYRLTVTGGQVPAGLTVPATAVRSNTGELLLRFPLGTPAFDFDLEVRAVDLNGNFGAPSTVAIAYGRA